ncbi:MAG: hypothetical protein SGILL_010313 [Bacillariaceae sp.]
MGSRGQSLDVTSHHTAGSKDKKFLKKQASLRRRLQTVSITSPTQRQDKKQQKQKSRRNLLPSVSPPGRNTSTISAISDSLRSEASCDDEIIECGPYRPQHHTQQPQQSSFFNDSSVSLMSTSSKVSFSERGLEDIVTVPGNYDQDSKRRLFYSDGELEEFRFEWEMERDGLLPTHT